MRPERLTEKAQEAVQSAAREAQERGQQAIEPEHLLLGAEARFNDLDRLGDERIGLSSEYPRNHRFSLTLTHTPRTTRFMERRHAVYRGCPAMSRRREVVVVGGS